jgi:hypothetical protein
MGKSEIMRLGRQRDVQNDQRVKHMDTWTSEVLDGPDGKVVLLASPLPSELPSTSFRALKTPASACQGSVPKGR